MTKMDTYSVNSTGVLGEHSIPVRRQSRRSLTSSVPMIQIIDPHENREQRPRGAPSRIQFRAPGEVRCEIVLDLADDPGDG